MKNLAPPIVLSAHQLSRSRIEDAAIALIRRALDVGITFLDTADIYGDSEVKVGKATHR